MAKLQAGSTGHFEREFEMRNALDAYYGKVLASKASGFSGKKLAPYVDKIETKKLSFFVEAIINLVLKLHLFNRGFQIKLERLIEVNQEAKKVLQLHKKAITFTYKPGELPFEFLDSRILNVASELKFKSMKYSTAIHSLEELQKIPFDSKEKLAYQIYQTLPHSVAKIIDGIRILSGVDKNSKEGKELDNVLSQIKSITDKNGKNLLQQVADLLAEKRQVVDDLCLLNVIQENKDPTVQAKTIKSLSPVVQKQFHEHGLLPAQEFAKNELAEIKKAFNALLNEADGKLAIFEATTDRLAKQFGKEILEKPISVTMVGAEYAGLAKVGGLAEALQGLCQGLLKQHPENKVHLVFPKYNILDKQVLEKLKGVEPDSFLDEKGELFSVYKLMLDGVEVLFIEHKDFEIDEPDPKKLNVYAGSEDQMKKRFITFSSLAADLVRQLPKMDMIHLHDWHVAGVELKLRNRNEEIAPITFTYHNNQRAAQGRYFSQVYNYEPVMQGLKTAGIARENVNLMVEAVRQADAVNTVSTTFAVESQTIDRGEGVSFAIREAGRTGKLSGIVNGANVTYWDPEVRLKGWKDIETGEPVDLAYSATSGDIVQKKESCKEQLGKWIKKEFPHIAFDTSKPIVTFIGRYDAYQKGLDTFEEAIEATLKSGGQFICMGADENEVGAAILDRLEKKYKAGVLIIRDYRETEGKNRGRLHYQFGLVEDKELGVSPTQGIGPVVRAATNFTYLPSNFEPCGLVQFESWLFGTPVITSNVGGFVDTVITPETSNERFNGFIFDHGVQKGPRSLASIMQKAIQSNAKITDKVHFRLMLAAKKCGWNDAPSGYSPVEQYRFVYENAKIRAKERISAPTPRKTVDITSYRHMLYVAPKPKNGAIFAEKYLEAYHNKDLPAVKRFYKKLDKDQRKYLPSAYGLDVDFQKYEKLGAHYSSEKTTFSVHVPHAKKVFLQLFDKEGTPKALQEMQKNSLGEWQLDVANIPLGTEYQYIIDQTPKIDPYGLQTTPVQGANDIPRSVVVQRAHIWADEAWLDKRDTGTAQAVSIYELHPTSWQTKEGKYLNYRELAEKLVEHCKKTGYTHVELMGILEHPFEGSYGYQVSNYFSPNSRLGTPDDFKFLIDTLHQNNIAVILDWIPAHFAIDDYALTQFDGTNQFEPNKLAAFFSLRHFFTTMWGTKAFNYKKRDVRDFLLSSAYYWLKEMHIDGLRVDAVRAILGSEDPESARAFLRTFNEVIHREFSGVLTIAEDYSGSMKITKAVSQGGYGFDLKWNVNWTKNIIDYLSVDPEHRSDYYNRLIQAIEGDLFHKMVMCISHDELMKSSLIDVTPNLSEAQKCANMRALFGFLMCLSGKKLLFMGADTGSSVAWNTIVGTGKGIEEQPASEERKKLPKVLAALHDLYKSSPAFFQHDDNAHDISWIEKQDPEGNFIAYRRESDAESFACFHNFSVDTPKVYEVLVPEGHSIATLEEVFNSNHEQFGGDGKEQNRAISQTVVQKENHVTYRVSIPPLSAVVIKE